MDQQKLEQLNLTTRDIKSIDEVEPLISTQAETFPTCGCKRSRCQHVQLQQPITDLLFFSEERNLVACLSRSCQTYSLLPIIFEIFVTQISPEKYFAANTYWRIIAVNSPIYFWKILIFCPYFFGFRYVTILTLVRVRREQKGRYTVHVTNGDDTKELSFDLEVQGERLIKV